MPKITFVFPSGESQTHEAQPGDSVMNVAVNNMVKGIIGECGSCCTCATCHVHLDADWFGKLPPPDYAEQGMLEGAIDPAPTSRLSCQIRADASADGLVCRIPAGQL
jgi:2Fe-2S ferredoxin